MSIYSNVRFLTSAAEAHQLAPDIGREIAFAGRSNSGKSTAMKSIMGIERPTAGQVVFQGEAGRPAGVRVRQGAGTRAAALAAIDGTLLQRA